MNPTSEIVLVEQDIAIIILFISFVVGIIIANLLVGKIIKGNNAFLIFTVEMILPISICYGLGYYIVSSILNLQF